MNDTIKSDAAVLLVDDEQAVLDVFSLILRAAGIGGVETLHPFLRGD